MIQKDLAEKYITKGKENAISFKELKRIFLICLCIRSDIKAAFNVDVRDLIENIPGVKWKRVYRWTIPCQQF